MSKQVPNPPHPGKYIRDELKARDWTRFDLANKADLGYNEVCLIINQGYAVNAKRAIGTGKAFGTSPELWMNLQQAYDLWRAGYRDE